MLVLNLLASEIKKNYTAYDCFHENGPYGKIPTKKEPIRMLRFPSRPSCYTRALNATDFCYRDYNFIRYSGAYFFLAKNTLPTEGQYSPVRLKLARLVYYY